MREGTQSLRVQPRVGSSVFIRVIRAKINKVWEI
jgi:hypothetical protein